MILVTVVIPVMPLMTAPSPRAKDDLVSPDLGLETAMCLTMTSHQFQHVDVNVVLSAEL